MRHQKNKKNVIIAGVAALSLTLMGAACGSDEDTDNDTPSTEVVPSESIVTPGSDTVTTMAPGTETTMMDGTATTMGG